jgi:hypothetical protein
MSLQKKNYPWRAFIFLVNLDIFREAVFLGNTPLAAALSITGMAFAKQVPNLPYPLFLLP